MDKIYANTLNEFEKIFTKKKTIVYILLTAVISIMISVLIPVFQSKFGIIAITAQNFPVIIMNLFTSFLMPLFILMITTDMFSGEVHDRTLKLVLIRPIDRFKVYASKNAAVLFYIILNLFIILVTSLVCEVFFKFSGSYSRAFSNGITAFLVSILPQLIVAVFASFICQFFKNSTGAFTTCIFILVIAKVASLLFPALSKILFINYLNWATLWLGGFAVSARLLTAFLLLVSYGIIFFTAGYYLFDKKEL